MDFVGNLSLFVAVKNFTNRLRIDKVRHGLTGTVFSDSVSVQCVHMNNAHVQCTVDMGHSHTDNIQQTDAENIQYQ